MTLARRDEHPRRTSRRPCRRPSPYLQPTHMTEGLAVDGCEQGRRVAGGSRHALKTPFIALDPWFALRWRARTREKRPGSSSREGGANGRISHAEVCGNHDWAALVAIRDGVSVGA